MVEGKAPDFSAPDFSVLFSFFSFSSYRNTWHLAFCACLVIIMSQATIEAVFLKGNHITGSEYVDCPHVRRDKGGAEASVNGSE